MLDLEISRIITFSKIVSREICESVTGNQKNIPVTSHQSTSHFFPNFFS